MDAQLIAALIQAAISGIGMAIQTGQEQEALSLRKQMAAQFGDSILPVLDRAVAQQIGSSAYSRIVEDPSLRRTQMDTLRELENIYRNEGMSTADIAALQLQEDAVASRGLATGANISGDAARRGMGGAGLNAASSAAAGQAATSGLAELGRGALKDARGRALQALEGGGRLAGSIRDSDYRRMSDAAAAQDRINLYDADQRNNTMLYNLGLTQQEFNNRMAQLQGKSNAQLGVASALEGNAARTGARFNTFGQQAMDAGIMIDLMQQKEKKDSGSWDGTDWGTDY